jgi:heat shock protein HslJ
MKSIVLAFTTTALCFLIACNNGKNSMKAYKKPAKLNGTWELNYISGPRIAFEGLYPGKKPRIVLEVTGKHVSGNTGCNSFSGPFTLDGSKINLSGPMILTKMFCPGDGENVFLETIKKIDSWSLTDDKTLNFIMGDVPMMRFTRVPS